MISSIITSAIIIIVILIIVILIIVITIASGGLSKIDHLLSLPISRVKNVSLEEKLFDGEPLSKSRYEPVSRTDEARAKAKKLKWATLSAAKNRNFGLADKGLKNLGEYHIINPKKITEEQIEDLKARYQRVEDYTDKHYRYIVCISPAFLIRQRTFGVRTYTSYIYGSKNVLW